MGAWPAPLNAQEAAPEAAAAAVEIDENDIGGVVTGVKGPEAGVWVIAETTLALGRRDVKIVVTDDQGPLPAASSSIGCAIQRVGPRLRARRFARASPRATPARRSTLPPWQRPPPRVPRPSTIRVLLVVDAPHSGQRPVPRHGTERQRHPDESAKESQADWMDGIFQNGCGNCHQAEGPTMRTISIVRPFGRRLRVESRPSAVVREWRPDHGRRRQQPDDD